MDDIVGKELTLPVFGQPGGRKIDAVDHVVFTVSARKMMELVGAFRAKVGLSNPSFFAHLEIRSPVYTEGVPKWFDAQGNRVRECLQPGRPSMISIEKAGGIHLFNIFSAVLVRSASYSLAALLADFGESSDLVELPADRLKLGQDQGSFSFAARW